MDMPKVPNITFGSTDVNMFPELDLDLEIPDIEAAIDELVKLKPPPVPESEPESDDELDTTSRDYKIGDRIWAIDQEFPMPLLATITEIYPDTDVVYFKFDGRPNETYSSSDHGIQLLVLAEDKILPASFRNALKTLWKQFVVRQVKFVKKSGRGYIKYYDGRKDNIVEYNSFDEAHSKVDLADRSGIVYHEYHYYGFTTTKMIYENDNHKDIEFFFGSENTGQLTHDINWSPFNIPMSLSNLEEHRASPLSSKLICGIPEKTAEGWQLGRWISCSRQFITLWSFVMGYSQESPRSLVETTAKPAKHHPKYEMLQDIFESLNTQLVARLCVDSALVTKIVKELKIAKQLVAESDCQHWITRDCDICGCHISEAASIYIKTMITVYGVPKGYNLFSDQVTS